MSEHRKEWQHGERVQVTGNVGDEAGSVRGMRGKVMGANPAATGSDGRTPMVNVQLEDGSVAVVPERALSKR